MIITEIMVAAPLFLSIGLVPLVLKAGTMLEEQSLHPLDAADPAGWSRSDEWLLDSRIEREYTLSTASSSSCCSVAEHSSGQWRTLRRHGSVQSVTLMQPHSEEDDGNLLVPFHSSVGNEYLKVMASAYAALSGGIDDENDDFAKQRQPKPSRHQEGNDHRHDEDQSSSSSSILHLGLGGGSLPMLIGEPCTAIELDEDSIDLAIEFCGLDPNLVSIVRGGDALHHRTLAPGSYSCIFVDVFGQDNNVPSPFVEEEFVRGLWDSLDDQHGGLVIANFHCNGGSSRKEEDRRLDQATQMYSSVFHHGRGSSSSLIRIPSRYQGNMILCARKGGKNGGSPALSPKDLDIETARQVANRKGWIFDPGSRLNKAEAVSFR